MCMYGYIYFFFGPNLCVNIYLYDELKSINERIFTGEKVEMLENGILCA